MISYGPWLVRLATLIFLIHPIEACAETEFGEQILLDAPCTAAIQAAIAFSNRKDSIFREEEEAAAYAFLLGIGTNDPRNASSAEAFGRGLGAAAFFCDRNPDISIFEVGRLIGRN